MERQLHSSDLYSHREKLLESHLIRVAHLVKIFLNEKPPNIQQKLQGVAKVTALCHDIGKSTNSFQKYLLSREEDRQKLRSEKTSHSQFSALCAYYLSKEVTDDEFLPFLSYLSVRRHHSDLINAPDEVALFDEKTLKTLKCQIDDIDYEKFNVLALKLKDAGLPVLLTRDLLLQYTDSFLDELRKIKRIIRKSSTMENYILLNLLYSLLIDADKSEVVVKDFEVFNRKSFDSADLVKRYITRMQPKDTLMNRLRQEAFNEVNQKEISSNTRIFSINLPTGIGKTLTGFSFALKLRNKLSESGKTPRIIYSLPFISIIDQNAETLKEVLAQNKSTLQRDIFLKHHHLTEIYFRTDSKEYEPEQSKLLIEGWNSEVIITTFVQLFHTLLSNKNSTLRKFHRLSNSIIILDEIQSIPVKYWKITREIISLICELLNSHVIIMTATEPYIFNELDYERLSEPKRYFKELDRFEIISEIDEPTQLEELVDELKQCGDTKTLVVLNTINEARNFFSQIKDLSIPMTYLSTHVVPVERVNRIREIKEGKYKVVVSTQIVEAGVDIDFEQVIRDIAPFDSIVQSAGRCNRNYNCQKGKVIVKKLIDNKNRTFSSYVYDPVLLDVTEKILKERKTIPEKEIFQTLRDYFNQIVDKISQSESDSILDAVMKLRYDNQENEELSISDFKLIEEDYPKIDVFIEYDDKAEMIWKDFQRIGRIRNIFDRRREFLKIKNDFYGYVVSVPLKSDNLPPVVDGFYFVSRAQLDHYYDMETGFKVKGETLIW